MPDGQSDEGVEGATRSASSSALLAAAQVGSDLAEQRALHDVKRRLFGTPSEPVRIGRYALQEKLGSGGLGVVYLARDPELDRRVAIKLMRSSAAHPARHLARFVREARSMAQVSHPNVVEVFDVGEYDVPPDWPLSREASSRGFFIAMAYVEGGSLRDWLAAKPRSWRKILDMLLGAGRGLAAAHAAGLCHRDFKPANVLVGGDGRPRVVDFGLARLVEHGSDAEPTEGGDDRSDDPSITATGAIVGTPAYMAPEQHRGEEVGPAADQFAFCVTAFEMLYGERPFPHKSIGALALAKQEGDIARVGNTNRVPAAIQHELLRGLKTSPAERHASMDDLIAALERAARGPLPRWAVASVPLAGLASVLALVAIQPVQQSHCDTASARVGTAWNRDRAAAVQRSFESTGVPFAASSFTRVSSQLDGWVEAWTRAHEAACAAADADGVAFDRGLACLARRLEQVETLVDTFTDADAELVERATGLTVSLPPPADCLDDADDGAPNPDNPEKLIAILAAREQLTAASTLRRVGRYPEARDRASAVLTEAAALDFDPLRAEALLELGQCDSELGDLEAAERLLTDAYYLAERTGYDRLSADAATLLVGALAETPKRFDEAMRWAEHARTALERSGGDPSQRGRLLSVTASVNFRAGRMQAAIDDARAAKELYEHIDTGNGDALATALANLGGFLAMAGRTDEAEPPLRKSLEIRESLLGPDHPNLAQSLNSLASVVGASGDQRGALALQKRALGIWEASLGPEHPLVAMALGNVATTQMRSGDLEAAESTARRALALREAELDAEHVDVGFSRIVLSEILLHRGKLGEAAVSAQRGLTVLTSALGAEHQYVAFAEIVLAQIEGQRGDLERAREHWERSVAIVGGTPDDPLYGQARAGLGGVLLELGDAPAAVEALELALPAVERDPSSLPRVQDQLARALWHDPAQHDRARELARVALNGYGADTQPDAEQRRVDLRAWLEATGDR